MTTLPSGDIFTRLCGWVENLHADKGLCLHTGTCAMSPCEEQISLADLRSERTGSSDNGPWSHIARHVREEVASGQEGRWTLIALWLLTPRLRGQPVSSPGAPGPNGRTSAPPCCKEYWREPAPPPQQIPRSSSRTWSMRRSLLAGGREDGARTRRPRWSGTGRTE